MSGRRARVSYDTAGRPRRRTRSVHPNSALARKWGKTTFVSYTAVDDTRTAQLATQLGIGVRRRRSGAM